MTTAHDIGLRSTAGDYPPEHDAAEREERRLEAIRAEAEEMADDALERGRWQPVEARLGMAWLQERNEDGLITERDDYVDALVDALVDSIADDSLGGSRAPGWVRRERQIRELLQSRWPERSCPDQVERICSQLGWYQGVMREIGSVLRVPVEFPEISGRRSP